MFSSRRLGGDISLGYCCPESFQNKLDGLEAFPGEISFCASTCSVHPAHVADPRQLRAINVAIQSTPPALVKLAVSKKLWNTTRGEAYTNYLMAFINPKPISSTADGTLQLLKQRAPSSDILGTSLWRCGCEMTAKLALICHKRKISRVYPGPLNGLSARDSFFGDPSIPHIFLPPK
jgi:hypothetical protein